MLTIDGEGLLKYKAQYLLNEQENLLSPFILSVAGNGNSAIFTSNHKHNYELMESILSMLYSLPLFVEHEVQVIDSFASWNTLTTNAIQYLKMSHLSAF